MYELDFFVRHFEAEYSLDVLMLLRNYGVGLALSRAWLCAQVKQFLAIMLIILLADKAFVQCKFHEANPGVCCAGSDVYEFFEIATSFFFEGRAP